MHGRKEGSSACCNHTKSSRHSFLPFHGVCEHHFLNFLLIADRIFSSGKQPQAFVYLFPLCGQFFRNGDALFLYLLLAFAWHRKWHTIQLLLRNWKRRFCIAASFCFLPQQLYCPDLTSDPATPFRHDRISIWWFPFHGWQSFPQHVHQSGCLFIFPKVLIHIVHHAGDLFGEGRCAQTTHHILNLRLFAIPVMSHFRCITWQNLPPADWRLGRRSLLQCYVDLFEGGIFWKSALAIHPLTHCIIWKKH